MKKILIFLCIISGLVMSGCTSTQISRSSQRQVFNACSRWGVVPLTNYTQTPQAGEKAATIAAGLLRTCNIKQVIVYRRPGSCKEILACPHQQLSDNQIRLWARRKRLRYVMLGSVNEWRYKVGLDGEPAVNLTLNILDVNTGKIVWNSVGSKVGGSRCSVGVVAHDLINSMLLGLVLR